MFIVRHADLPKFLEDYDYLGVIEPKLITRDHVWLEMPGSEAPTPSMDDIAWMSGKTL